MTFAPKLEGGIGFEEAVQTPNIMANVAQLAQGMVNTSKPKTVSASDQKARDKITYFGEMARARAIKKDKPGQANRIVTNAAREWGKKYGTEDEDVQNTFSDFTGASYNEAITGSVSKSDTIVNTPEFDIAASVVAGNNPDWTQEQVYEETFRKETNRRHTAMRISEYEDQEKINWVDAEGDYVDKARDAGDTLKGIISQAEADKIITPQESEQIRSFHKQYFGDITKPKGLDEARWKTYKEEYIQPLNTVVEAAIGIGEDQGISQVTQRAMKQIIGKAVNQGKLSPMLLTRLENAGGEDWDVIVKYLGKVEQNEVFKKGYDALTTKSFDELVEWVTEFEFKDASDFKTSIDLTEYNKMDNRGKRERLLTGTSLLSPSTEPGMLSAELFETNAMLESVSGRALQPTDFKKVFGASYFASIDKIYKANPSMGISIAEDAVRVLESQKYIIAKSLESEANQLGFRNVNGRLVPDKEMMNPDRQKDVDMFFGGDWEAAMAAEGVGPDGKLYVQLNSVSKVIKESLQPKLDKFIEASRIADDLSKTYLPKEVLEQGQTAVQGTTGKDKLEAQPAFAPLIKLVDKFEGVGDYDTLFGHSQKSGGKFSGMKVSQMTIGQLKDFSGQRGAGSYGEWVKGANPKGDLATPMGRYQFVGTTLADTAAKMGLSDDVVFDENTQDAMFAFKARQRLQKATTPEGKRKQMRDEWAGFKKVKDPDLDKAIAAFEGGGNVDFGGFTVATGNTAPTSSSRPPMQDETPDVQVADAASVSDMPEAGDTVQGEDGSDVAQGNPEADKGPNAGVSEERADQVFSELSKQTKGLLLRLFGNEEGIRQALISGELSEEELN